jgi:hypothetical protein
MLRLNYIIKIINEISIIIVKLIIRIFIKTNKRKWRLNLKKNLKLIIITILEIKTTIKLNLISKRVSIKEVK